GLRADAYTIGCRSSIRRVAGLRLETLPSTSLAARGLDWNAGNFHLTELRAELRRADRKIIPLEFRSAAAGRRRPLEHDRFSPEGPWSAIDGNPATRWDASPQGKTPHWLALKFSEPFDMAEGDRLIIQMHLRAPSGSNLQLECFRLAVSEDARDFAN